MIDKIVTICCILIVIWLFWMLWMIGKGGMITKYILLREIDGEVVHDILTLKELCKRIVGLNKGIIYTREGELVVAFSEHNIKINRDLQSFPEKLIKSLF